MWYILETLDGKCSETCVAVKFMSDILKCPWRYLVTTYFYLFVVAFRTVASFGVGFCSYPSGCGGIKIIELTGCLFLVRWKACCFFRVFFIVILGLPILSFAFPMSQSIICHQRTDTETGLKVNCLAATFGVAHSITFRSLFWHCTLLWHRVWTFPLIDAKPFSAASPFAFLGCVQWVCEPHMTAGVLAPG